MKHYLTTNNLYIMYSHIRGIESDCMTESSSVCNKVSMGQYNSLFEGEKGVEKHD